MEKVIQIRNKISIDLALREVADSFFNEVNALSEEEIWFDFSGVRSISRSFAHQYLTRKKLSPKKITELKIPWNIEKMLAIVNNASHKRNIIDINSMQVMTV